MMFELRTLIEAIHLGVSTISSMLPLWHPSRRLLEEPSSMLIQPVPKVVLIGLQPNTLPITKGLRTPSLPSCSAGPAREARSKLTSPTPGLRSKMMAAEEFEFTVRKLLPLPMGACPVQRLPQN